MANSNINFTSSGVTSIDLSSGDVTTDLLIVSRLDFFTIEAINFTGDGSPTWSLKATNVNDSNELVYYTDDSNNLSVTDSIINRGYVGFNYLSIEIKVNDNTTGAIEFIYTPIK
jgi:hypothetical protein